jgi:hypothetical protein
MLGAVKRILGKAPVPYEREVATALLRDGFDPKTLDEMQTLGSFSQSSLIFRILAERKLEPVQAALAIRMASRRYLETRLVAEAEGWPLRSGTIRPQTPRNEAYFLELLDEAAESLRFM